MYAVVAAASHKGLSGTVPTNSKEDAEMEGTLDTYHRT